jgi:hypothetical protein
MPNTDIQPRKPKILSLRKQTAILKYIASGKTAKKWLDRHKLDPSILYRTLHNDVAFSKAYALARLSQAETYVDDIIAISDDTTGEIQRDKLRVDSRKWIASKINPGKWGDKLAIETTSKVSILDHLNDVINVTPSAEIETDRITN